MVSTGFFVDYQSTNQKSREMRCRIYKQINVSASRDDKGLTIKLSQINSEKHSRVSKNVPKNPNYKIGVVPAWRPDETQLTTKLESHVAWTDARLDQDCWVLVRRADAQPTSTAHYCPMPRCCRRCCCARGESSTYLTHYFLFSYLGTCNI